MSSNDVAISVRGLSKQYLISREEKHTTLAEKMVAKLRNPFARPKRETFEALKDVSFDVKKGDVVGIMGRNGAGKSTLLKVLSRITEPTKGRIEVRGRVGSLLEVGTGFHQELSGRDNIFLNGAILGMRRGEIQKQFDAIVDFAGVEGFLDTPVKRYSSGMYVRLAFAVAAHLNPEILIVDEVLAVGDAEFQKKCLGKMKDVATGGRTVLFVSHNMQAINLLCNRGVCLQKGKVQVDGDAKEAISEYMKCFSSVENGESDAARRRGSGEYRYVSVEPTQPVFNPGEPVGIKFTAKHRRGRFGTMHVTAHVVDELGTIIAQCDSRLVGATFTDREEISGVLRMTTPWLKPGTYRIDMFLSGPDSNSDIFESACRVSISPMWPYKHTVPGDGVGTGIVLPEFQWTLSDRNRENVAVAKEGSHA